jgi:hypothetical protein
MLLTRTVLLSCLQELQPEHPRSHLPPTPRIDDVKDCPHILGGWWALGPLTQRKSPPHYALLLQLDQHFLMAEAQRWDSGKRTWMQDQLQCEWRRLLDNSGLVIAPIFSCCISQYESLIKARK